MPYMMKMQITDFSKLLEKEGVQDDVWDCGS